MKNRIILICIAVCLIIGQTAFASGLQSSETRLRGTIEELEMYLVNGIEDEAKLLLMQENFYSIGGKYGKLFGVYCEALSYLAQGRYELAIWYGKILENNEDFKAYLGEIESISIEDGSVLITYIKAREAEASGDEETALSLYMNCFTYFDVLTRHDWAIDVTCEQKYSEGNDAMERGDYETALECFKYTSQFDYKNSVINIEIIENIYSRPETPMPSMSPSPTATPTPAITPMVTPAPTPEASTVVTDAPKSEPSQTECAHADVYWVVRKRATCTETGSQKKVCSSCGRTLSTSDTNALGHKYVVTSVTAATCTAKGYTSFRCERCNNTYNDKYSPVMGHSYGAWAIATDTTDKRVCSKCSASETRNITYGAWSEWTKTAVSAVKGSVQVESKVVNEQVSTKTTYSYKRYLYYNKAAGSYYVSYGSTWAINMGYGGKWQNITRENRLTYSHNTDGYSVYTGYSLDGVPYWFYEVVNAEPVMGNVTYYRSRRRTN